MKNLLVFLFCFVVLIVITSKPAVGIVPTVFNESESTETPTPENTLFIFGPDGELVYIAQAATKEFVVLDGREGVKYDGIVAGSLGFNSDGKLFYIARSAAQEFVVLGGKEEIKYDRIIADSLVLSPNGKLTYLAQKAGKEFVVSGGKAGKGYDQVSIGSDPVVVEKGETNILGSIILICALILLVVGIAILTIRLSRR